ncbi:hypothetical protein R3P38DRAFT_3231161 [Favolaschia claudopus]|uniref:Uncharacterized protein n=1 Tax=Favolaschia claudopus TaxID=2862362 RepID=A0AAV9ZKQ2_9AGAR
MPRPHPMLSIAPESLFGPPRRRCCAVDVDRPKSSKYKKVRFIIYSGCVPSPPRLHLLFGAADRPPAPPQSPITSKSDLKSRSFDYPLTSPVLAIAVGVADRPPAPPQSPTALKSDLKSKSYDYILTSPVLAIAFGAADRPPAPPPSPTASKSELKSKSCNNTPTSPASAIAPSAAAIAPSTSMQTILRNTKSTQTRPSPPCLDFGLGTAAPALSDVNPHKSLKSKRK